MGSNKQCMNRLQKEYRTLLKVGLPLLRTSFRCTDCIREGRTVHSPIRISSTAAAPPGGARAAPAHRTQEPVPHITAHPLPNNLLEWHFVLEGAADSEYAGGVYHGRLVFPAQYPFKPPSISLYTPTGRFAINTKLCLSITDYHPESWNPMWSVGGGAPWRPGALAPWRPVPAARLCHRLPGLCPPCCSPV
jgi:hypothetical protein